MRKNTDRKPSLDEYDNLDIVEINHEEMCVAEYVEMIENHLENEPKNNNSARKTWLKKTNELIDECNRKSGIKIYAKRR